MNPITREQIDELLRFLPIFEDPARSFVERWDGGKHPDGTITMPFPVYRPEVLEFFHLAAQPQWTDRKYHQPEAAKMVRDAAFIARADLDQIRTMLTFCARGERFCDGHWAEMIESGTIAKLLRRLKDLRSDVK